MGVVGKMQKKLRLCTTLLLLGFFAAGWGCNEAREHLSLSDCEPGGGTMNMPDSPWTALLDGDRISYPLELRSFRKGDTFVPLGMSGHKKLKDFFIDLKISSRERALVPILASRDHIIWVCGLRVDDRYKVTPETKRIVKVILSRKTDSNLAMSDGKE